MISLTINGVGALIFSDKLLFILSVLEPWVRSILLYAILYSTWIDTEEEIRLLSESLDRAYSRRQLLGVVGWNAWQVTPLKNRQNTGTETDDFSGEDSGEGEVEDRSDSDDEDEDDGQSRRIFIGLPEEEGGSGDSEEGQDYFRGISENTNQGKTIFEFFLLLRKDHEAMFMHSRDVTTWTHIRGVPLWVGVRMQCHIYELLRTVIVIKKIAFPASWNFNEAL